MVDETTTAAQEISIATQQQRSASDVGAGQEKEIFDEARQPLGLLRDHAH